MLDEQIRIQAGVLLRTTDPTVDHESSQFEKYK
jgi:hypothetical protein